MSIQTIVDRLKNPKYTGTNRCLKCTYVNVAIASVGGGIIAFYGTLLHAGLAFVVALCVIYFWGYLIPGTPRITKQYFPASLYSVFHHTRGNESQQGFEGVFDVEQVIVQNNIASLEEEDLQLDPAFRNDWSNKITSMSFEDAAYGLESFPNIKTELTFRNTGGKFCARHLGEQLAVWESKEACIAHFAGMEVLPSHLQTEDQYTLEEQYQLVGSLRLFTPICPCGGGITEKIETIESCCDIRETLVLNCSDCGAQLFEMQDPP
ncbi:hypothetical protein [Haloferax gibbonsii]|uniref:hypothetical protein n=1 Tax=Haloferax gibbonsii TaxID=35746 RepID=UPI001268C7D9|nr:hypothetical protein [Haloferax gibbonsii]